MEKTINIKFDEEQLEDIVKKVTENIMKKAKEEIKTETKLIKMYLDANEMHSKSDKIKIYFGHAFNTLSEEYASDFDLSFKIDRKKVEELKSKGWKEEVVYK